MLHIVDLLEKYNQTIEIEIWIDILKMDENSAMYTKTFTIFLKMIFQLFLQVSCSDTSSEVTAALSNVYSYVVSISSNFIE